MEPTKEKVKENVADVTHMSKPDAPHVKTLYDSTGRWMCEIYTVGHIIR